MRVSLFSRDAFETVATDCLMMTWFLIPRPPSALVRVWVRPRGLRTEEKPKRTIPRLKNDLAALSTVTLDALGAQTARRESHWAW